MTYAAEWEVEPITREDVDRLSGPVLVEFGQGWCPFCREIQPELEELLRAHPEVRHIKVADGPGKRLGRSFRVKLWPNLVFMRDGVVKAQLARPEPDELEEALDSINC